MMRAELSFIGNGEAEQWNQNGKNVTFGRSCDSCESVCVCLRCAVTSLMEQRLQSLVSLAAIYRPTFNTCYATSYLLHAAVMQS
jgi:hypothetical protein